jgi:U6 snRNA-associated Sm-like protein LSm8
MTTDGRILVGNLRGLDQALNAVVSECEERLYSKDEGMKVNKIGLYLIRGDNVASLGEIDEELEETLDYKNIRAEPLKPISN